jgi:transposase
MISRGEDVEAQALKKRGWSTAAIARHLGRDRKTIRAYLNGEREPGVRRSSQPGALEPYRSTWPPASPTTPTSGPVPSTTKWCPSATRAPT